MDTESVLSDQNSIKSKGKSHKSYHYHRSNRSSKSKKDERMAPYQTSVTLDDNRDGQEVIEVQILPQDENWGENTTAVTGNTSEQSGSLEDLALWPGGNQETGLLFLCHRYIGSVFTVILSVISFLSPLLMLALPKLGAFSSVTSNLTPQQKATLLACGSECKGMLLSFIFKMILLAAGAWAVFLRHPRATMPRIFIFRGVVLMFLFICTIAYWLFFIVQMNEGARATVTGEEVLEYRVVVSFASSFVDTLLFIHYITVVLIEIRHLQPAFYIKVTRSPDGDSKSYAIGQLSIQRAAVWVLQKYYTEFPIYNPYLEKLPVSKSKKNHSHSSFKFYDVDGGFNNSTLQSGGDCNRSVNNTHTRRRDSSHNERFYEEHDYERRVKKRRARLITTTEEAFTHIKRTGHQDPVVGGNPMDSYEAAQAVFPSLARALQKYLRVTRQQPRHSVESILSHLALCLSHDLSPRAFLEPFLVTAPVLQNEKEQKEIQSWSLICDELLTRPLHDGTVFQLLQNELSLICSVHVLPHFNISEEVIHPKSNRFLLRMSSETSV